MTSPRKTYLILLPISAIILGIGTIILSYAIITSNISKTNTGVMKLFFNENALILYIPSTIKSLKDFRFEIINQNNQRDIIQLGEFAATANYSLENFPSPLCVLIFVPTETLPLDLIECNNISRIPQSFSSRNLLFWIDPTTQSPTHIRILSGNNVVGQCDPNTICSIDYVGN